MSNDKESDYYQWIEFDSVRGGLKRMQVLRPKTCITDFTGE